MSSVEVFNQSSGRRSGATVEFYLGCVFLAISSYPTLINLPAGMTPGQLLMLVCAPFWFFASLFRGYSPFDPGARLAASVVLVTSLSLVFCALTSTFVAESPFRAARPIVSVSAAICIYMMITGTISRDRIYTYISVLCLPLALSCLISLIAIYFPPLRDTIFSGADRAFGFFKNPNQFGIAITTLMPVSVAMAFSAQRRRMVWRASTILLLLGLLASGSKANILLSMVTVPFCVLVFVSISSSGVNRWLATFWAFTALILTGAGLLAIANVINPRVVSLLGDLLIEGDELHSFASRRIVWEKSWSDFLANPILGVGGGQFTNVWEKDTHLQHSHNLFLEYARTLGLPGLVLISLQVLVVFVMSASTFLLAVRNQNADLHHRMVCIGLTISPVVYVASNMSSDSMGPTTSPFFFATVYLGLAARRLVVRWSET